MHIFHKFMQITIKKIVNSYFFFIKLHLFSYYYIHLYVVLFFYIYINKVILTAIGLPAASYFWQDSIRSYMV